MNSLLANTTAHRRMIMFLAAELFGIFTTFFFYKIQFTISELIIPPIVGLLIFECLFRTRKWLTLKTLLLYIPVMAIISELAYSILYSIFYRTMGNPLLSLQYLISGYPDNIYYWIEISIMTGLAFYLIKIYKNETWVIQEQATAEQVLVENPSTLGEWLHKYNQQITGFFGWYLAASLVVPFSFGLITTPVTIILLISFAMSKSYKGLAGGILTAVALNFLVSIVRGATMSAYCFMPFYYDFGM